MLMVFPSVIFVCIIARMMYQKQNAVPVLTIDGPSGVGKGTLIAKISKKLPDWHLLDSGAIYRVLAYKAHQQHIDSHQVADLVVLAKTLAVQFFVADEGQRILLEGTDITWEIREESCGNLASKISQYQEVRSALLYCQRKFCRLPGLIADGRDMGTVVFPDAILKIYLDADPAVRAKRRHKQLLEQGINVTLAQVFGDMQARDSRDKQRQACPLKPAADALVLDTTAMDIGDVFYAVCQALDKVNISAS